MVKCIGCNVEVDNDWYITIGPWCPNCIPMRVVIDLIYKEYVDNGYRDRFDNSKDPVMADIAELGFITTEPSEGIEAVYKNLGKVELALELADTIIRASNMSTRKGNNVVADILTKHLKNMKRGKFHGKKGLE
jgi:thiol-disulfide isomerase/thioredoxin